MIALFTNARDEKNIKEWAAHHILLGFDAIFIFDHKSVQPLRDVFANFDKRVTILNGCHLEGQVKLKFMDWALQIAKSLHIDCFLYLDADEFLILNEPYLHVKQFLKVHMRQCTSLGLNWLMFGTNYLVNEPTSGLLIENYTKSDAFLNQHVKSFTLTRFAVRALSPHAYLTKPMVHRSLQGAMSYPFSFHSCGLPYEKVKAYIAHYYMQSEETYKRRKLQLPRDDTGTKRDNNEIPDVHNCHNEITNTSIRDKYASQINNFLSN